MIVSVAGKLLAVLLALIVANPVCCCTIGELLGIQRSDQSTSPTGSCCAAKNAAREQETPDNKDKCPSCPCDKDNPILVEAKTPLPDAIFNVDVVLDPPLAFEIAATPAARPPALAYTLDIPLPPPSWRLHCSYLL
jgi:hypothetical protein